MDFLPIGTVVRLHKGMKMLMINGRIQKAETSGKVYDYSACLYPEGNINSKQTFLFNKSDIEEVIYIGYINEQEKELCKKLGEIKY